MHRARALTVLLIVVVALIQAACTPPACDPNSDQYDPDECETVVGNLIGSLTQLAYGPSPAPPAPTTTCPAPLICSIPDCILVHENGSFEVADDDRGLVLWQGDVARQTSIPTCHKSWALGFEATTPNGPGLSASAQVYQIVDYAALLEGLPDDALGAAPRVRAWAAFGIFLPKEDSDRQFGLRIDAYAGDGFPQSGDLASIPLETDAYQRLATVEETLLYDLDGPEWQSLAAALPLPVGTDFLVVALEAVEDGSNDAKDEFDGQAADFVHIALDGGNAPPVARADQRITSKDTPVVIHVTVNDTDPTSRIDRGSVTIVQAPAAGSATVESAGRVRYVPHPGFTGTDTLTYTVADEEGRVSNEALVTVAVRDVNGPPVVDIPIGDLTIDVAAPPISIDLTRAFADPEGDPLTYTRTVEAGSADVFDATLSGTTLTITPRSIGGPFQVQVVAEDDRGRTATSSFSVTVETSGNAPPVVPSIPGPIADQAVRVGTSVFFELDRRFADPDFDPLTYTATPDAGSEAVFAATLTDDRLRIDGLSAGGPFDLTVTAADPFGATATMTFAVVVFETNTPPALVLDFPGLQLALGQPLTFDVAKHFADPDSLTGEPLIIQAGTGDPSVVTAAVAGSALTLTPQGTGSGSASVSAFDVVGANTGAAFTVSVGSGDGVTPIANEDRARTIADAAVVIDILDNDTDPNGDGLDIMQVRAQPVNGTATFITQDGITQVTYQPDAGFTGTDTFTYRYLDQANNWSNDATVEVIVEAAPAP